MKKIFYLSIALVLFKSYSFGQITFERLFADSNNSYSIEQTFDGGFILSSLDNAYYKLNQSGDTVWAKRTNSNNYLIHQTKDSGYVLIGSSPSATLFISKLKKNGDTIWSKGFNGDYVQDGQQTLDGGYIVACSGGTILKLNSVGDTSWSKSFFLDTLNILSIFQTTDKGYIISGIHDTSLSGGLGLFYLVKVDSSCKLVWCKGFGQMANPSFGQSIQTKDGGYVSIFGYSIDNKNSLACVLKTNSLGDTLWTQAYSGTSWPGLAPSPYYSIKQTSEGGYIFTCWDTVLTTTWTPGSSLVKTNSKGIVTWTKTFSVPYMLYNNSGNGSFLLNSAYPTKDKGFIVAGLGINATITDTTYGTFVMKTDSNGNSGGCNIYPNPITVTHEPIKLYSPFIKISKGNLSAVKSNLTVNNNKKSTSYLCGTLGEKEIFNQVTIKLYPNPNDGCFTIDLQSNLNKQPIIQLYNILGEQVYTAILNQRHSQINISKQPAGLYLYRVINEEGQPIEVGRFIIK